MDKLVDFRSVDQRIKYKCSWSPTHRRPWCFKHFLAIYRFFDGLSCQLAHTSCYIIVMFSCTCTHTSCYVMVIFSCTCSHTSCYAMVILGPLTPHRFLEELCKAVKAMKRFWEEGKKVLHPKKTRTYVKKQSSFGDFQNPIFHVNMRKNDDEKLLKPYGRLWVGNQVVIHSNLKIHRTMGHHILIYRMCIYIYITYILHLFKYHIIQLISWFCTGFSPSSAGVKRPRTRLSVA